MRRAGRIYGDLSWRAERDQPPEKAQAGEIAVNEEFVDATVKAIIK
jgi:hypothetical protein